MTETFAALLLAHLAADFVLQTSGMVERKREPLIFLAHIVIVLVLSLLALGGAPITALAVAVAHLAIDAVKTFATRNGFAAFIGDQAAHTLTLAAAALIWPEAFSSGVWGRWTEALLIPALVASGAITTVLAGGHAVGLLMRPYKENALPEGLPDAGRLIGQLERSLIFLLVLTDQTVGIGFLIAAKSILRFDAASKEQKASEYVIIGTLASFSWAIACASATLGLIGWLSP